MGKTNRKVNHILNIPLPTVRSLKTLRKRAGKARAIIKNTISPKSQLSPETVTEDTVHQRQRKNGERHRFVLKLEDDHINRLEEPEKFSEDKRTSHKLRRSLRLFEKSRNTFSSYFSQEVNSRGRTVNKNTTDFDEDCDRVSKYFSQPQNSKICHHNSQFKLNTAFTNKSIEPAFPQSDSPINGNIDEPFKLSPLISSFFKKSKNTNLDKSANCNFEQLLSRQIKVQWTTDIRTHFARTITKGMEVVNNKLSGLVIADDNQSNQDYATQAQLLSQPKANKENYDNGNIVLDQKIYDHRNSPKSKTSKVRCEANTNISNGKRKLSTSMEDIFNKDHPITNPHSTEAKSGECSYRIPPSKWVMRTPEKKRTQQPRLDNKTAIKFGLVSSSKRGNVSFYTVNKEYENKYFIGDDKNVPVSNMVFGHMGDFQQRSIVVPTVRYKPNDAIRHFEMKTSTTEEVYVNENTLSEFPDIDDDDDDLDLSPIAANLNSEYDPFLIGRPTKRKTISRRELRNNHNLINMENNDPAADFNFIPRRSLFQSLDPADDDVIMLN